MEACKCCIVEGNLLPNLTTHEQAQAIQRHDWRKIFLIRIYLTKMMPSPHELNVMKTQIAATGIPAGQSLQFDDAPRKANHPTTFLPQLSCKQLPPTGRLKGHILMHKTEQIITGTGGTQIIHPTQAIPFLPIVKNNKFEGNTNRFGDIPPQRFGCFRLDGTTYNGIHTSI